MAAAAIALATLIAQELPVAIGIYKEIQQANSSSLPPVETILATADADWDAIAAAAQAELAKLSAEATKAKPPTP